MAETDIFFLDFTFLHLADFKYYKEASHVVICGKNSFFSLAFW